jgi:DNA-binding beta-propeller fold protein YncE
MNALSMGGLSMNGKKVRNAGLAFTAVASVLSILSLAGCQTLRECGYRADAAKTIEGFSSPESVAADPAGKRVFVSNMGAKLEPGAKDGDGFISALSEDGGVLDHRYLPKEGGVLHSPKGMAIAGRTLYVTDVDRIVGYDIDSREEVFVLDFSAEKTTFLNDIAVRDADTLFVSATDVGKVYTVALGSAPSYTVIADGIKGPNGLYYDSAGQRLFVAGFGTGYDFNGALGVITFVDGKTQYAPLTGPLGALDGVALMSDGRVIFSDWVAFDKPGVLRVYDLKTGELSTVKLSEEARGPADFLYDAEKGRLWLPRMLEGKVMVEDARRLGRSDGAK